MVTGMQGGVLRKEYMVEANRRENERSEAYFHHHRPEMLPFVPPGISTILDIGCGAGDFGQMLKTERNSEVW